MVAVLKTLQDQVRSVALHKKSKYFTRHNGLLWLWLSIFIIVIDQLSKAAVMDHLVPGQTVRCLPFLNLSLAYNSGAAFSFLGGESGWQMPLISAVVIAVIVMLLIWLSKCQRNQYVMCISLSLIIGGAIGNLIDRLRLSVVVDFLDFHVDNWHFATFNIADAAITVGAVLLVLKFFFGGKAQSAT